MCGIAGLVLMNGTRYYDPRILIPMQEALAHRGPDDRDVWAGRCCGLAATRLAVLDTSTAGRMPMASEDGRYRIVHNGEIYNHVELRDELLAQGHSFRSRSDTEVLLKLYAVHGAEMLEKLNGMFAFAIWDETRSRLFAARDRFGEKPFFYSVFEDTFYFGSEHKALFAAGVPRAFDPETWNELLWYRAVAGEATPFQHVRRLLPGHYLTANVGGFRTHRWYQPEECVERVSDDEFLELFQESVRIRRRSDVRMGVLLSGGLDSSAVAAILAEQAGPDIPSFHVGFDEEDFDERAFARMVAEANGHEHHEIVVERKQLAGLLEEATWLRGEPMTHNAGGHLLAISRYAKQHVTVLLSGEGSDEMLGGYSRYRPFLYPRLLALGSRLATLLPFLSHHRRWDYLRAIGSLGREHWVGMYGLTVKGVLDRAPLPPFRASLVKIAAEGPHPELVRQILRYDQHTALNSVLDQSDRFTMGAGVECRLPFMDYRVCEMARRIPTRDLFSRGRGKQILVRSMVGKLPQPVLHRSKQGFSAPWERYLRELVPLNEWVRCMPDLDFVRAGPLEQGHVRKAVHAFLEGDNELSWLVWALTRISLWHEVCVEQRRVFR